MLCIQHMLPLRFHDRMASPFRSPMLNLLRKFLRPTLREQLEAGVREALRRYADRRTAPNLRVFVSTDLIPTGMDEGLWARDESEHLRRFALQWSEDNNILRTGLRLEVILLDTKREFAFVKPVGLERREESGGSAPMVAQPAAPASASGGQAGGAADGEAMLEVVTSPALTEPLRVRGDITVGRKSENGVTGIGDRYMSSRHARLRVEGGQLWVTDLDSKNRTYLNEEPLPPHQPRPARVGDTIRMGTTTLRLARVGG
jgi:hypothetical protein